MVANSEYYASLIDEIYEASVIPEYWEHVCDGIAAVAESFSASVIGIGEDRNIRWIASPCIQADMERFSKSPLSFANVRPQRHIERAPFSFLRDIDTMTKAELATDPIYEEFLRPIGLGCKRCFQATALSSGFAA